MPPNMRADIFEVGRGILFGKSAISNAILDGMFLILNTENKVSHDDIKTK
jgi:hypothetical protein